MTSNVRLRHTKDTDLYATASDFCRIFEEDMDNLYSLALLLTADSEKAEQCFVSGLENCSEDNPVFKEWSRSWARRTIIKTAIRLIAPDPSSMNAVPNQSTNSDPIQRELRTEISVLLNLQPFERFAFVMSVLEGYTERDSALLLGCTRESLIAARTHALQQITHSGKGAPAVPSVISTLELPVALATPA